MRDSGRRGLELSPPGVIDADGVVTLPRLKGPQIEGLPPDADGFIRVDERCAVVEVDDVYAAGDATSSPVKQGGLATQQADAIASTLAARAGGRRRARAFPARAARAAADRRRAPVHAQRLADAQMQERAVPVDVALGERD